MSPQPLQPLQELSLYQRRLDVLPEATSQQLQRLNEDLGTVKSQLAVLDSEQTHCRLGALEETLKGRKSLTP